MKENNNTETRKKQKRHQRSIYKRYQKDKSFNKYDFMTSSANVHRHINDQVHKNNKDNNASVDAAAFTADTAGKIFNGYKNHLHNSRNFSTFKDNPSYSNVSHQQNNPAIIKDTNFSSLNNVYYTKGEYKQLMKKRRIRQIYKANQEKAKSGFNLRSMSSQSLKNYVSKLVIKFGKFLVKWAYEFFKMIFPLIIYALIPILIFLLLFFMIFQSTSSSGIFNNLMNEVAAAYPADENDITRVNLHWQSLIVSLKEQHKKVPETVTEHYDKKKSQIADIMEDNNKVLSFISAYYMGKKWTFNEEVQNLVTQIFTEMYVIEYSFDSETKKQTKTVQIPENELPSPLPDNYTVLSTYNGICNVYITENVTTVTLNYNITEKVSWDEILKKYLINDEQKEKYKNYYERKGGAIKAFSSPFAFDWSNTITSPFGYRTWDDGSTEFHKGLDFGVPNGTEILAVADGIVEVGTGCNHNYPKNGSCGCNGGFGNYVEIQCENGTLILYGHMSQVAVQNGQTVKNGQVIGYSGCTGWSTGFHCHLQMVKDGEYIDPLVFIRPYTGAPAEKEENN